MHTQNHSARSWTLLGLYTPLLNPRSLMRTVFEMIMHKEFLLILRGTQAGELVCTCQLKDFWVVCYNWLLFIIVLTTIYVTENFKGYFQIVICQLHLRLCHILYIQYSHFGLYLIYSYKNFSPPVVELGNRFLVTFLYFLQYLL
jgi:hypothetical protein